MYPKEFNYAQQFIKNVNYFASFSGHRQTCISEPMKESSGPFSGYRQSCIAELMKEKRNGPKLSFMCSGVNTAMKRLI
jgi:hypothetical protein